MNSNSILRKATGNLINLRRRALGMSLTDFSLKSSIPVEELIKLEKGTLNYAYRISAYQQIADILDFQSLMKLVGIINSVNDRIIDRVIEDADKFNKSLDVVKPLTEQESRSLNEFREVLKD